MADATVDIAAERSRRAKFLRWIVEESDTEEFLHRSEERAGALRELNKSQIRNFEHVAYDARAVSDVSNFIKSSAGRERTRTWAAAANDILDDLNLRLGPRAKSQAQEELSGEADEMVVARRAREYHLALIREYAKQIVAHYEFMTRDDGGR
jgi:replicative superfamily II helicase